MAVVPNGRPGCLVRGGDDLRGRPGVLSEARRPPLPLPRAALSTSTFARGRPRSQLKPRLRRLPPVAIRAASSAEVTTCVIVPRHCLRRSPPLCFRLPRRNRPHQHPPTALPRDVFVHSNNDLPARHGDAPPLTPLNPRDLTGIATCPRPASRAYYPRIPAGMTPPPLSIPAGSTATEASPRPLPQKRARP